MKKLLILTLLLTFGLFSCNGKKHYKEKVQSYKTHSVDANGNDVWLYYYLFWSNNNSTCYYYSSSTPVSSFSNVDWTQSSTSPVANVDASQVEELAPQEVPVDQMSAEMQTEMDNTPENFEGMTQDEMGDYEGGGNEPTDNTSSESSSDAGSSDAGSSDGGGGDGGGGGGE